MLLVGFDSAWTPNNSGAIVGVHRGGDGVLRELGAPRHVDFGEAEKLILRWQSETAAVATIVFLDQPTIVKNASGSRPVESIVSSPVSRRLGAMQPANTAKAEMFGADAPVWRFLSRFGGPANLFEPLAGTWVVETYPVLALIALGWTLADARRTGRLPKYNPARRKNFSLSDWEHVCRLTSTSCRGRGLVGLTRWLDNAAANPSPRKGDQDCLDACLCLLTSILLAEGTECLMVGDHDTGYIVVPFGEELHTELHTRCERTGRAPTDWVRPFSLDASTRCVR
jgi:predicted RNase H-like nuclease